MATEEAGKQRYGESRPGDSLLTVDHNTHMVDNRPERVQAAPADH